LAEFCKTRAPLVALAVPTVRLAPLTARVPVKLAVLLIVWELIAPEVVMVVAPLTAPELIIRPLMVLVAVAPDIAPDKPRVVTPDTAPAVVTSKLVELIASGALPPPMLTVPLLVPVPMLVALLALALILVTPVRPMLVPEVTAIAPASELPRVTVPVLVPPLMLVLKLELSFREIAAPEMVLPAEAVNRLEKVLAPARVWTPVVTTPPKEALAGSKLICWVDSVIPLALGLEPMAARVTALCSELLAA
jgi:hypothetical protein